MQPHLRPLLNATSAHSMSLYQSQVPPHISKHFLGVVTQPLVMVENHKMKIKHKEINEFPPRHRVSQLTDLLISSFTPKNDFNVLNEPNFYLGIILLIFILYMKKFPSVTQLVEVRTQAFSTSSTMLPPLPLSNVC